VSHLHQIESYQNLVKFFFSHFLQSSEISAGHVFHLFKLKFPMVTSLLLLRKEKYQNRIAGFRIVLFESRIDLCLVSTKSRVTRSFRKIGPPLFSSSGNQSFRYTIRFTSTLSFECSYVQPISPLPYCFPVLQPFRVIALAYFSSESAVLSLCPGRGLVAG
jgi:hypothetical protein